MKYYGVKDNTKVYNKKKTAYEGVKIKMMSVIFILKNYINYIFKDNNTRK